MASLVTPYSQVNPLFTFPQGYSNTQPPQGSQNQPQGVIFDPIPRPATPTNIPVGTPSSSISTPSAETILNNAMQTSTSSNTAVPTSPKTFYRRELPAPLISFNSAEGRRLFKESLADGSAEAFLQLSGNLAHQSDPAFCGLGSLAIVLNALEVDPKRAWKGVWRWYDETLLECAPSLDQIRNKGMTFDEFARLARCNGLQVVARRGDEVTKEEFLNDLKMVSRGLGGDCDNDGEKDGLDDGLGHSRVQMVVSFSRKALGQTGDGHFSPIGAYHEGENKALVLDVARFKYPSYFVSLDMLYESLKPVDKETGMPRGYFLLKK
ncbi:hypothetical protein HDU76_008877, partial [Blyttiomyces sp. JEL0837]